MTHNLYKLDHVEHKWQITSMPKDEDIDLSIIDLDAYRVVRKKPYCTACGAGLDAEQERRCLNQHAVYLIQIARQLKQRRTPLDKPVTGRSFKEFLRRGPLADIDLPRIEGHEREIDL